MVIKLKEEVKGAVGIAPEAISAMPAQSEQPSDFQLDTTERSPCDWSVVTHEEGVCATHSSTGKQFIGQMKDFNKVFKA